MVREVVKIDTKTMTFPSRDIIWNGLGCAKCHFVMPMGHWCL